MLGSELTGLGGKLIGGLVAVLAACGLLSAAPAVAAPISENARFTASDGVTLQTTVTGEAPLAARPVIVEFSPYGRNSGTFNGGGDYNHLLVQIRGTGDSDGRFDALGPRTQKDVEEVLGWACNQPWSDGRLGLNGFSASAITIYNSLHLTLPCVRTAVLKSGTHELYRDLLLPGGTNNLVPGAGVLMLIGAPALGQGGDRLARDPASGVDVASGLVEAGLTEVQHPTLDSWWQERGFRGDANNLPILMVDGFFDVESRGAFQGYQELRDDGAHLVVIGAHDGAPAGTDAGTGEMKAWFDHYLRGVSNGVESHPRAQLWLSDGDREDMLDGKFARFDGSDWPVPDTKWVPLSLDAAKSGSANSINDGTLSLSAPGSQANQVYPAVPTLPLNTDPPNTAIIGAGTNPLAKALPITTEMTLSEPLALSYTTAPLSQDVLAAGPASLELNLSSTAAQTGVWAVLSDVTEDGTAHPLTVGRLNTDFPGVVESKSLKDGNGTIVQPYGDYTNPAPGATAERHYRVELWPVGNRFRRGHRIRLDITGTSLASLPGLPALNTVRVGGPDHSRLHFPVLPGSDLTAALSSAP